MDLPVNQDDARVAWVASFDVVDLDARRYFDRVMLEAHDDEMFCCGCQLYVRQSRGYGTVVAIMNTNCDL